MLENFDLTIDSSENKPSISFYKNTILEFFQNQVLSKPNHMAVKIGNEFLTYRELDERSDQLALSLLELGVGPDSLVTVLLPKSIEMIVSIFGILKAGGAYLPLGPRDGEERITHILDDSQAEVLITQEQYVSEYKKNLKNTVLDLNLQKGKENWINFINVGPIKESKSPINFPVEINPNSLVYVIYTSGTTGKPKGVMIEHHNLYTYIKNFIPEIDENDRVLHSMNAACDSSIGEIFPTLCNGASLILWQENLSETIKKERITYTTLTPSMAELVDPADCTSLKKLILGGEKLNPEVVKMFPKKVAIYNGYGPTEGTVDASITRITDANNIHIGDCLPHVQLYVVNNSGELCKEGEPGELWIGGGGIGRGYLNRDELTLEKFIPNPFGTGRLYKTGDLVCWDAYKRLDFLGRIDRQVKVRGFRVELDGLENLICSFPGITGSYIIFQNKNLIGYLTPNNINLDNLREFLGKQIPDYSIPSKFIVLEKFPTNSAGKVDEKALLEISTIDIKKMDLPQSNLEKELASIWRKIIDPKLSEKEFPISLNDNFFDLGGNSLDALVLTKKLQERLNPSFSLEMVYSHPTFYKMVQILENEDILEQESSEEKVVWSEVLLDGIKSFLPTTYFYVKSIEATVLLSILAYLSPLSAISLVVAEFLLFRYFKFPHFTVFRKIDLFLSNIIEKYKSVEIIEEVPVEKIPRTAFLINPHGITDHHIRPVERFLLKKGVRYKNTHHDIYFKLPFCKTWYSLQMGIPAEEKSYFIAEKDGYNLLTALGEAEALRLETPGVICQSNQKVFFKYILQTGTSLTPIYVHGNHLAFKGFKHFFKKRLGWYKKDTSLLIQPFWGRWFLPIPFKVDLKITIGTPLEVTKIERPTWEEVERLYSKYRNHLNEHYKKYAPPGVEDLKFN